MKLCSRRFVLNAAVALCTPTVLRGGSSTTIELVLLLDGSGSMFEETINRVKTGRASDHHNIQREGHIDALRQPEVVEFLIWHNVHVQVYVWSDSVIKISDVVVTSRQELNRLVAEINGSIPRRKFGRSSLHDVALQAFTEPPPAGIRRVIDISTDEELFYQREERCSAARDEIYKYGGTINVLAVDDLGMIAENLQTFLQTPDGFTEVADGFEDYARAIKAKLIGDLF